ncbi:MAG TPA: DUF4241 domain-containing protein [Candidatus Flavonifractor merdigallinarum]|uniref:DUF4241 domain-containing protein n=1 Tax=Candidatus Flavonifractor merdigallinarum TaxID=2838589 RepID=A0A9D1Y6R5_9FIRM|nr:DUF4241 domain-containing protein [Candidatus Flavonifractor merdigallinarum]
MPEQAWLDQYEKVKKKLEAPLDLNAYFTQMEIGGVPIDWLEIGRVHFPTGRVLACDPLLELLDDCPPYLQQVPPGRYLVTLCVVPHALYGDRYACAKVTIRNRKPVRYELAMTGRESLKALSQLKEGDYFGFGVDGGMACIADQATQEAFRAYWRNRPETENFYDDLFCEELEKNAKAHPKYQRDHGDWLNWTIPGTDCNLPIFTSGWGDGYYPCYFGYDAEDQICGIYLHFIDIAAEYAETEEPV